MNRSPRPFAVTCLIALVLTFTGTQLLRAWVAARNYEFYSSLPMRVHPLFIIASGILWAGLAFWLARGLWHGVAWAPNAAKYGATAYFAFGWLDRFFLQTPGPQQANWQFEIIANLVILAGVFSIFALPNVQTFFGERDERSLKNRTAK